MCAINKDLSFYSLDYSLTLNINDLGGVFGEFYPFTTITKKKYPFRGCSIREWDMLKFTFFIDWSFPDEGKSAFTCFAGQIINQNILILDWLLAMENAEENYGIKGTTFLYSALYFNSRDKTPPGIKPFPIDISMECSSVN